MATFEYRAFDQAGKLQKGKLDAATEVEALKLLSNRGLYPEHIDTVRSGKAMKIPLGGKPNSGHIALLARQLESIIGAGVSVEDALTFVARNGRNEEIQNALNTMLTDIRAGLSLSDAARKHPKLFDGFFVGMINAGESTGELEPVLGRVAAYNERQAEIRRKVSNAMIYPMVILFAGIGLLYAMMAFVVPRFVEVVADLGTNIPWGTKLVINISNGVQAYGLMALLFTALTVVAFQVYANTKQGKLSLARFLLAMPLFGNLVRQQASASFASSLAFASDSGLEILAALDVAKESATSEVAKIAIDEVKIDVQRGTSLPDALRARGAEVFDPLLADMAAAGSQAGEVSRLLTRAADFFERNINSATEGIMKAVEPALTLVIGVVAAGIVMALFFPIIELTQQVGNM